MLADPCQPYYFIDLCIVSIIRSIYVCYKKYKCLFLYPKQQGKPRHSSSWAHVVSEIPNKVLYIIQTNKVYNTKKITVKLCDNVISSIIEPPTYSSVPIHFMEVHFILCPILNTILILVTSRAGYAKSRFHYAHLESINVRGSWLIGSRYSNAWCSRATIEFGLLNLDYILPA